MCLTARRYSSEFSTSTQKMGFSHFILIGIQLLCFNCLCITAYSMLLLPFILQRSASFKSVNFSKVPRRAWISQTLRPPLNAPSSSLKLPYPNDSISFCPVSKIYLSSPKGLRCFSTSLAEESSSATTEEEEPMVYPAFAEIASLHPLLKKNVEKMNLKTMTEIQAGTWEQASSGQDVLGRARTGTGKTVAFLLPAIHQLLDTATKRKIEKYSSIQMLVLSPTRELASQIHDQAMKLTSGSTVIKHQVMFGGEKKGNDISAMNYRMPTILVATPGRLKDHLENTELKNHKSFSSCFGDVKILVLDETDRLLDMGFRNDVDTIMSYLPNKENRQTLLFSATVPKEVKSVIRATMRKDFVTVDCIHDTDPASHTNAQVEQSHVIVPSSTHLVSGTVQILGKLIADTKEAKEPLKLVAFFNTAHAVSFYADLFAAMPGVTHSIPMFELHSRKSQSFRTRTSDAFRAAKEGILFTSDVSARGVDYPGVTDVVQFGIPDSRESYIHRLGRTGRAGKQGEGLLVLSDLERNFLKDLSGLDVGVNETYQNVIDGSMTSGNILKELNSVLKTVENGSNSDLQSSAQSAYRSLLGFYNGKLSKLGFPGADQLIDFVNCFAKQTGLKELPEIEMQTVKKMGLKSHTGLNVVYVSSGRKPGGRGGGRGGRGNSGAGRGGRGNGMLIDTRGRDGAGYGRQMSTVAEGGALPMKRANSSSGDSAAKVESNVVRSTKKSKKAALGSRNRDRRPTGRGA